MYKRLLAAIDRTDPVGTDLIGQRCKTLVDASGPSIALIHVRLSLPESYVRHLPPQWEADEFIETENWLRHIAMDHGFAAHLSDVFPPTGNVASEVTQIATNIGADLIIVAAQRATIGRRILGSNAHAIMRDAPCDVLIVRD
jgi:nucleotide-binding universal stress UspA family protein